MDSQIYTHSPNFNECLRQAEIVSGIIQLMVAESSLASAIDFRRPIAVLPVVHEFAIVMTQGCDLVQDFNARAKNEEQVPNVLFCPLPRAEALKRPRNGSEIPSRDWKRIQQNDDKRYHFFEAAPQDADAANEGLPELTADFKRYFTMQTAFVYRQLKDGTAKRRCELKSPYLEHFSFRFAFFLGRIGLPEPHQSEPA
ncbi:MAG: hypothetical protein K2X38_00645 [Gemmataceae bacterium]|nr:hypothetical protein [Gemmataceae bacterium]